MIFITVSKGTNNQVFITWFEPILFHIRIGTWALNPRYLDVESVAISYHSLKKNIEKAFDLLSRWRLIQNTSETQFLTNTSFTKSFERISSWNIIRQKKIVCLPSTQILKWRRVGRRVFCLFCFYLFLTVQTQHWPTFSAMVAGKATRCAVHSDIVHNM